MRWSWRLIAWTASGATLVAVSSLVLRSQTPLMTKPTQQSYEVQQADMRVQQVHLVEQAETGETWELVADEAEFYDAQHLIVVHRLHATLRTSQAHPLYIVAESGHIDHTTGNVMLRGGVRLTYLEAYTIVTEILYWQAATQSVQTPAAVTVESATVHMAGLGLLGQIAEQRFVLQDEVHATFRVP